MSVLSEDEIKPETLLKIDDANNSLPSLINNEKSPLMTQASFLALNALIPQILSHQENQASMVDNSKLSADVGDSSKPFICVYCGKGFPFYSVLQSHERVHTGEKPFQCNVCNKTFAQRGSLTIHQRRHTGEKPYKCSFCDKTFASQGNMKIHERQHTGVKPYKCEECDKTFATIGSLRTHEISHSDLKQFQCDLCGKDFAHRTSLYTHKKEFFVNCVFDY